MNSFDMNPTGRNSFCECAAASPRMEPTPPNPNPPCTEKSGCAALKGFSLAMAYVPMQCFENLYCPEDALCAGTLFVGLDKPFCGAAISNSAYPKAPAAVCANCQKSGCTSNSCTSNSCTSNSCSSCGYANRTMNPGYHAGNYSRNNSGYKGGGLHG